ncbi:MAG: hypothetical protein ACOCXT_04835 [Candidatus Dojkabacteria bacterium]
MPETQPYQNQIEKLNQEVSALKDQLIKEQLRSQNYQQSYIHAQKQTAGKPSARETNSILQQIRKNDLTIQEKQKLVMPELLPSPPQDIFYQWVAPNKLSIKRDKQWYWTMGLLLMIMIAIATLFREMIWIALAMAFFFALYVNATIGTKDTVYRLTRQGIEIGEGSEIEIYAWDQLLEYAVYYKSNTELIYVDTILAVPQRIYILFSQEDRKNIGMILEANLSYKPPPKKQTRLMKLVEGTYIPLEDFKLLQEKIDQYYDAKYAEILRNLKQEGRIDQNVTVGDIRHAESMETLKIIDDIKKQKEEEYKKILGI